MHMAIGSKSNVQLVYVGWSNAVQDFLLAPCCTGVLSHCVQCLPLHFRGLESNVIEVACWILVVACVHVNLPAFTALINSSGNFSKTTQQQGSNYLTPLRKKSARDHNGPERGLHTRVTSLNMAVPSLLELLFIFNH